MKHNKSEYLKPSTGGVCDMSFYWANLHLEYQEVYYFSNSKDYIYVQTATGKVKMWTYGQYTLFDTKEERDQYRAEQKAEREATAFRNKMIRFLMDEYKEDLESKSTESLMKIVDKKLKEKGL